MTSRERDELISRVSYVIEYVFGGNVTAASKAFGVSDECLYDMLHIGRRARSSVYTRLARSRVVSAEWLFCGTGPMLTCDVFFDEISGFSVPRIIQSKYPLLDVKNFKPESVARKFFLSRVAKGISYEHLPIALLPLAHQIFTARKDKAPVILSITEDVIASGIPNCLAELARKRHVTGIALSLGAAEQLYLRAGYVNFDAFIEAITRGASDGIGFGELFGRYLCRNVQRKKNLMALCHDSNIPVTIHGTIGETMAHYLSFKPTPDFGAALGAVLYVDSLIFAAQIEETAKHALSLFVHTGLEYPGIVALQSVTKMLQQFKGLTFDNLKIWRLGQPPEPPDSAHIHAPYRKTFPALISACRTVYEGIPDARSGGFSGEKFTAFRAFD